MPKRNTSEYSTRPVEDYQDEHLSDLKQSTFDLDHPPDDWRQTNFAHNFTDELKAINDQAAANFDSGKSLTEYTSDERKQLAYATAEAFRNMDFPDNKSKVEAALDLSHSLMEPVAQEIRLEEAQLRQEDIDVLKRAGVEHVLVVPADPADPSVKTYEFTVENRDLANTIAQLTGAQIVDEEPSTQPVSHPTSYRSRYIDVFSDRFALELLSDPATHDNDAVGHALADIMDQAVDFAKDPSLGDKDLTSFETLSQEQDPYARDLLLDLAAQAPMQDIRKEIFILQHTTPDVATAAHTATDAITTLYRNRLDDATARGNKEAFDKAATQMNDFATTFAAATRDSTLLDHSDPHSRPDVPEAFATPTAALEYIDAVKTSLEEVRTSGQDLDYTVVAAIANLTDEFQRVNATYSYNLDPTAPSTNVTDWQQLMSNNPALDDTTDEDRQAAEDFYMEMAGISASSDPTSGASQADASAAKEDHYRLHRLASGIDHLMKHLNTLTGPRSPVPATA